MEHTAAAEYYNAYVHWNLMHYNALKLIVVLNSHPKISPVEKHWIHKINHINRRNCTKRKETTNFQGTAPHYSENNLFRPFTFCLSVI